VGIFGHRNMRRQNWLGVSRCRLVSIDGLDLHVEDLDAVDGTPVLDIKPWFAEMGPRGETRQPSWVSEMLGDYFAPRRRMFRNRPPGRRSAIRPDNPGRRR
jgi:tRNA (Thr-GGU) A37 N-methylase